MILNLYTTSLVTTLSYYAQDASNVYNQLRTPLKYLSTISPTINTLNYIARTQNPWFLDYLPGSAALNVAYKPVQNTVEKLSKYNSTLTDAIRNKKTAALLSAIGTTSSLISCGAPAILILSGSILAATATWQKQKRTEELATKENLLDKHIVHLAQEYPYTCEETKLSIGQNLETLVTKTHLEPIDYAKLALDISIAFCCNPLGQTNILLSPSMLLYEKRRIAQIEDKEKKLEQMLAKLKPEDREKVKAAIGKMKEPAQKQLTLSTKIQPRKKIGRFIPIR